MNGIGTFELKGNDRIQITETLLILLVTEKSDIDSSTMFTADNKEQETIAQHIVGDNDGIDVGMANNVPTEYTTFMKCNPVSKRILGFYHHRLQQTDFQSNILTVEDLSNEDILSSDVK